MLETLNFTISIIALIVAISTAIAAHHYYVINEQGRRREILMDAIQAADEAGIVFRHMERERIKTGQDLSSEEASLFQEVNAIEPTLSKLSTLVNTILVDDKKKIPSDMVHLALSLKKSSTNLNCMATMLHDRFVNFNNNRIHEIASKLEAFQNIAQQLSSRQM